MTITLTPEQRETLIDVAYQSGLTLEAYSGRYMYGKECMSFTAPRGGHNALAEFIKNGMLADEDLFITLVDDQIVSDSMGLDIVLYWPNIEWADDESDEDDE